MIRLPRGITVEVTNKKRGKTLIFAAEKVDYGPLGELVGNLADKKLYSP